MLPIIAYTYNGEPLPCFLNPFPEWIPRATRWGRCSLLKVGSAFSRTGTCYQAVFSPHVVVSLFEMERGLDSLQLQ